MWRLFNSMRDMYSNVTLILTAVIVIILTQVNPKAKPSDEGVKPPGEMMVCIYWEGHNDVDMHARSPDDEKEVWYRRPSGKTIDLVRDDLGTENLPHSECQFARQLPDGRWAFNILGYALSDPSVSVRAEIRLGGGPDGFKLIYETTLDIKYKQERTIAQFRLSGGKIVPESLNTVFAPLRSAS